MEDLRHDFFTDIFGGAPRPRSIFSHQISADASFYDDVFWSTETAPPPSLRRRGRNLPLLDIPSLKHNQKSRSFIDIFGLDAKKKKKEEEKRSYSESAGDVAMSAAKLRAMDIKTKWTSTRNGDSDHKKWALFSDLDCETKLGGCPPRIEENVTNIEQIKLRMKAEIIDEEMEIDEDEFVSSYVIELDCCSRETASAYVPSDVDEAIAWAKQKLHSQEKPTLAATGVMNDESRGVEKEDDRSIVDEKIRLWLSGKESDIRLLLSSLHRIVWPNSGWMAIPLTKLMESSQVKKAYQKAILCLHPDKLQQRGASLLHKYIAHKVFAALQDAWTTFSSLDVSKIY
ncbi:uncharacterized protein LOC121803291 isoform X1 [Salvia splendens]|uniref:uncharacterized protein LOC121803291 isoform X1 n=1 Tax=Salvia splendens TaxID=180675 RepID=UPI001C2612B0|nr:uncharacterized protein LOC121803291 isoform X1 [Salvia splendens]